MTLVSSKLRPGLLVSLKTSLQGNVSYTKTTLDPLRDTASGGQTETWRTTRNVADKEEWQRAEQTRNKCGSLIRGACISSAFGLLCPDSDEAQLETAINEAHTLAKDFNASARLSRVRVYIITGRIAPDDVEAVKAINSEVRDLMADMAEGLDKLDIKKVREAASRAKAVGAMLTPEAQARIKDAVDLARKVARKVAKAGEQAAIQIDKTAIRQITEARTAFLDLDEQGEVQAPAETGVAIDLEPAPIAQTAAPEQAPLFDLGDEWLTDNNSTRIG